MGTGHFATIYGCIDGRTTVPVTSFLKTFLHVDFVDYISEPGPDNVLLRGTPEQIEEIKRKLGISLHAHHSNTIAVVAHHDCAGYPVTRDEHLRAVRACVLELSRWQPDIRIIGLWVNDGWEIEAVCDTEREQYRAA